MNGIDLQIGGRIRRLRRQKSVSQAQLAEALEISASYLNLIEHNRRRITVPLLFRVAGYFGVEPGELAESDDARLAGDLMEMFGDDIFADADLTNTDIRDLATHHPAVGRAVLKLFDQMRHLQAPKSSAAELPVTGHNVVTEAVSDFLQENANYFPTLEAAAERVRQDIDNTSDSFEAGLKTYLFNVFGIETRLASLPNGVVRRLDESGRVLLVSDTLEPESELFTLAQHLALLVGDDPIGALIEQSTLPQPDSMGLARNVLASYLAAALVMPYEAFFRACRDTRYDIERLGRRFRASFEQVCHRMTTLQRPSMSGIPLHLVRTDIAGNISKRFSLSGIHIPRHSGACPRWNVYSAFLNPGQISVQLSQMPDGQRYFCIAKAITKGGYAHNAPRRHVAIGLGCHVTHAAGMIYADGVDLSAPAGAVPIGVGCRICPRRECGQRAHPPADHRFMTDDGQRMENLYMS
ncbi:short-chain fatty acyl-CoA regulator family protein [Pelagibacterium sp. H642]|uniref:helix-turn-helix domain-containing protein n=1 Tax=Pelagibacterium sp. H642 TaxID=1881069 RepID=UPI00281672E4|nr:short-chain fatty acyl-CoA regulator family protein [Pelagibacterium sp. H642]WMT92222.1 short-chain fatty acyl-CoA regulator family protein [Pelagibacterium sp. H642]